MIYRRRLRAVHLLVPRSLRAASFPVVSRGKRNHAFADEFAAIAAIAAFVTISKWHRDAKVDHRERVARIRVARGLLN